jgi:chemotaxis protein MotB
MALGEAPIIIKKIKKSAAAGHHGGAWKVAYADFVTAMMAFFLLMWLINTTSPEQKKGIADYFAPASVSETTSGSGGILGGTALGQDGDKNAGTQNVIQQTSPQSPDTPDSGSAKSTGQGSQSTSDQKDDAALQSAAQSLKQALQDMPELAELSKQIQVDVTPEGLRIQLLDQEGRSMFKENSAQPNDRAQILLHAVTKVINQLPNRISITGHTSATPGMRDPKDWQLSSARADASRQILQGSGVDGDRIAQVTGKASSDPLYPDDPTLPGNRRITIVLLREKPVLPTNANP